MKREVAVNSLQQGDHKVFVDAGSRAESHWLGLGYLYVGGTVGSTPGEPEPEPEPEPAAEKPKRRGRKAAVETTGDE